ncbi:MAG TPA: bifunctional salicylyl-CoA 5-hydroxylase/oxidoreductase, partial [Actinomycetota bacterium]|nr:bifunctional salicylyl-CoA 5-hydroxylase/oxidoreductase [Actinomycetota bacterium]
ERWRAASDAAHDRGAVFAIEIGHAGRRGATRPRSEGLDRPLAAPWELIAPSPLAYGRRGPAPREMTEDDMQRVGGDFAAAAKRAALARADLLLVHMGHGYLIASFLSPLTNRRSDRFGGSLEARMTFPLEVLRSVREGWSDERPLGVVLTATDWARGGLDVEDAVAVARTLREHGCLLVLPVAGQTIRETRPRYGPAYLSPYAERIRTEARVATIASGRITTSGRANTIVGGGRADLVVIS